MDELEISGRRHISSARAAKEYKYHADYIGQLVRGGKVEGQKVGRAWYVDAESLAEYLGKEVPARGPVITKTKFQQVEESSGERPLASVFGSATDLSPEPLQDRISTQDSDEEKVIDFAQEKKEIEPEFILPLRKSGRQHVVAALDSETINKEEKKEIVKEEVIENIVEEPASPIGFVEELVPEAENLIDETDAEETSEETFIPVKISTERTEPEDSFYKVSSKGLRYIPAHKSKATPRYDSAPVAASATRIKPRRSVATYASAISLVLVAGIVSLGAGVLMSYYLHSVTTIGGNGQSSTVLLSN